MKGVRKASHETSPPQKTRFPSNFKDLLPRELKVSCGEAHGTWVSSRFKRGHKSRCILHLGSWVSPLAFSNMDAKIPKKPPKNGKRRNLTEEERRRALLKDWKERIIADGSSIGSLFIKVRRCKDSCKCALCFNTPKSTPAASGSGEDSASPEASLLPPTPLRPPKVEAISSSTTSTLGSNDPVRESLVDLNDAVQRALASLGGEETSQLHILLFILHFYEVSPEDVPSLNKRLKKTLAFLTRMDVLHKKKEDGEEEDSSESESESPSVLPPPPPSKSAAPKKQQPPQSQQPRKVSSKKPKLNTKENKVRKPVVQKPKSLSPSLSSICGGARRLSRHDVLRRVWAHIKKRNLQDSERKNVVKCDDKLRELINEDEFPIKNLLRILDAHMS
eukprot:TRINITY_DN3135_c0_g1_i2.p1 TRINITY_DN3135_c0_g1~~TRINITY_DN3135_c0_g1_i2.p1  ORF type:complete len:390 (-),score=143.09 TRINITY_DN3135_c0_g1_i2:237-1406(-)